MGCDRYKILVLEIEHAGGVAYVELKRITEYTSGLQSVECGRYDLRECTFCGQSDLVPHGPERQKRHYDSFVQEKRGDSFDRRLVFENGDFVSEEMRSRHAGALAAKVVKCAEEWEDGGWDSAAQDKLQEEARQNVHDTGEYPLKSIADIVRVHEAVRRRWR